MVDVNEFALANMNLTFKLSSQMTLVWARLDRSKRTQFWEIPDEVEQ